MGILLWIVFGGLVGWLASIFLGTNAQQGIIGNIVLGILGAFIGGILSSVLGFPGVTGFNLYSVLIALLGAITLVSLARLIKFN